MIGTCEHCGKQYKKRYSKRQFCSIACRGAARRLRVTANCSHCGKVIEGRPSDIEGRLARNQNGIYCSGECAQQAQIGRALPSLVVEPQPRECLACGKTFFVGGRQGKKLHSQYCSRDCALRAKYHHGVQANQLSIADAAYLAGFIDGEGTIMFISRANNSVGVLLTVTNTKKAVIDWIAEVCGVGRSFERPRRSDKHARTFWWQASSEAAESIIQQILPYLKIKREQAELALEFQDNLRIPSFKANRELQAEYRARMKILNRRGPQPATEET